MPISLVPDRQYTAPAGADSVAITPNAVAWVNSAYVTVLDPTPAACVLTGLTLYTAGTSGTADVEVDVATGAAGLETVIATVRGFIRLAASNQFGPSCLCVLPIPIDNIAAGVRVSVRLRKNSTLTTAWVVALTYLQKPVTTTRLLTAVPQKVLPPATAGVTLTAGTPAWADGTWGQLRAATGAALVVTGIVVGNPSGTSLNYELDLGTGTAGAETVITTVRFWTFSQGVPSWFMLPNPLDQIGAGVRVAARLRCATAATTLLCSLMVLDQPL